MSNEKYLTIAIETAKKAGKEILGYYNKGDFTAEIKDDNSPVTSADIAANNTIIDCLKTLTPDIPIVSEETSAADIAKRKHWTKYWLLDPIDGTGEFILGSGDFAVNIALVENNWPTIGVIHAPDHQLTYFSQKGAGAYKENTESAKQIFVNPYQVDKPIKVAISRRQELSLMGQYLNKAYNYEYVALGSCSLKNCLIAEGGADCYLRIGPTGEWDTGASQSILEEAGGTIVSSNFESLSYNQRDTLMNPDFIGLGDQQFPWRDIVIPHVASRKL
ncbi:3'(2'),5'-bisphosphate nucleotidase CysQ [Thalassotalea sp. LPB0316]|uniref:3'(2'),5'-bisphosphate nucleotidase CysQ n=1 Tax=Thalassotalea sp. LPB0316 TaxID=2769490 RepID=UPI001868E105|nr:3'(2'),5'-bisphosphate nucleotidase CysQ [Thalassotalea sp. LPB0316]QOL26600.1 3'(2'),5'-bisphosphate nucleotidase CysQ [Thalassotalea sp. LPB0316]